MKKVITLILLVLFCCSIFVACQPNEQDGDGVLSYTMVAPDGAPALAISKLMAENYQFNNNFTYKIVGASDIKNHVVGNVNKHADFALLPVNLASLLLGEGDEYKMIGVVTHGNLFFLSKNSAQINADNAQTMLKGKSIAVVNLAAVPGLTTKALLSKVGLSYTEDATQKTAENVFLKGINGTEIGASLTGENAVDYVIAPEPAVSTITAKVSTIQKVGALHDVYGRYPQAVLVVKTAILNADPLLVKQVFASMQDASDYVKANTEKAVSAIQNHLSQGVQPSFNAQNTTANSIDGCGINVKHISDELLQQINGYIADIIAVQANSAKVFPQTFFVNVLQIR